MDALTSLAHLRPGINDYTDEGYRAKRLLHSAGRSFLRRLASDLGLQAGTFDIRSNRAGAAVSGEVTLHADSLYVQISEHCYGGRVGLSLLYRTCEGRQDYTGGPNHTLSLREVRDRYPQWVAGLKRLAALGAHA